MRLLKKIQTFLSLPWSEQRCYFAALLLFPVVDVALRLFSWPRCQRWADAWGPRLASSTSRTFPSPRRIAWLVERAARHCPWPATCLRRSLVLWLFLGRSGVASEVRVGFRQRDGVFEAHAWVEWNGVVLNDAPDVRARYAVPAAALQGTAGAARFSTVE